MILLLLRAADGAGLGELAARYQGRLLAGENAEALARESLYSPATRYTAALVAPNPAALEKELTAAERALPHAAAAGTPFSTPRGSYFAAQPLRGRVAFVYPGTFAPYTGAGRDLLQLFPRLRLPSVWDTTTLTEGDLTRDLGKLVNAGVILGVLHTRALREVLGIRPDGGLGYSLGEISMLFAMDVWSPEASDQQAVLANPILREQLHGPRTLVRNAWNLPGSLPDEHVWSTHVVFTDSDRARSAVAGYDRVFLTHINTPNEVVLAGEPRQCRAVISALACASVELAPGAVMHAPLVEPALDGLMALNDHPLGAPDASLELLTAADFDAIPLRDQVTVLRRLAGMLRSQIDFTRLVHAAYERGFRSFIEVGPAADATRWIGETLGERPHLAVSADHRGVPAAISWVRLLARLAGSGHPLEPGALTALNARTQEETTVTMTKPRFRTTESQSPLAQLGIVVAAAHRSALRVQAAAAEHSLQMLEESFAAGRAAASWETMVRPPVIWDETDLLEFSLGSVAKVFGPDFAAIDELPHRVRLPAPPYLFVSRVTALRGTPGRFEPASITIEYDVPESSWFSVDRRMPLGVLLEVSQCGLLLISLLGVDFRNQGRRVFRLLDGNALFHDGLPSDGQTLRYELDIKQFVWRDDQLIFFFDCRAYAGGRLFLEIHGCGGFFTFAELAVPLEVVATEEDRRRREAMTSASFEPLARTERVALNRNDLEALAAGKPGLVFGPAYDQAAGGCNPSPGLPAGDLLMLHKVTEIDRLGGILRLGRLSAVQYIRPGDWYFSCHFPADPVLPGSLILEASHQLMQVYAFYLGLHLVVPDAQFQSVPGRRAYLKMRGQVPPDAGFIRYEAEITEIKLLPRPTIFADIAIYRDDKAITVIRDLGLQVQEKPGTSCRPELGGWLTEVEMEVGPR